MTANIDILDWDTSHFGIHVGMCFVPNVSDLNIDAVTCEACKMGLDVLYIRLPYRVVELDQQNIFCDERIVYAATPPHLQTSGIQCIISYKNKSITNELLELAFESGLYSRYRLDKNFPNKAFENLYSEWICNSVNTDFAKDVLVYWDNISNRPIGLLTYNITDHISSIGIIAVKSEYRGRHIGTSLIKKYLSILPSFVTKVEVITQGINLPARKLYESCGYYMERVSYTYHYWIKEHRSV